MATPARKLCNHLLGNLYPPASIVQVLGRDPHLESCFHWHILNRTTPVTSCSSLYRLLLQYCISTCRYTSRLGPRLLGSQLPTCCMSCSLNSGSLAISDPVFRSSSTHYPALTWMHCLILPDHFHSPISHSRLRSVVPSGSLESNWPYLLYATHRSAA